MFDADEARRIRADAITKFNALEKMIWDQTEKKIRLAAAKGLVQLYVDQIVLDCPPSQYIQFLVDELRRRDFAVDTVDNRLLIRW